METHDCILPLVLRYSTAREIEAMTVASKYFATQVLPNSTLWKEYFCRQWGLMNFKLDSVMNGTATITISSALRNKFPSEYTESRIYQILTHAIEPQPSYVNLEESCGYQLTPANLGIESYPPYKDELYPWKAVNFRYTRTDEDNRCVRGCEPYRMGFHIVVVKTSTNVYSVTATTIGYFEISIQAPPISAKARELLQSQHTLSRRSDEMTSIGVASSSFVLYGSQPGWKHKSYGYHGDDGRYFDGRCRGIGRSFGSRFGLGETVGCGLKRYKQSTIFFTNNGAAIDDKDLDMTCSNIMLYPIVGIDSPNLIHINFGQEPFQFDVLSMFNEECEAKFQISMLNWYAIANSVASRTRSRRRYNTTRTLSLFDSDINLHNFIEFENGIAYTDSSNDNYFNNYGSDSDYVDSDGM